MFGADNVGDEVPKSIFARCEEIFHRCCHSSIMALEFPASTRFALEYPTKTACWNYAHTSDDTASQYCTGTTVQKPDRRTCSSAYKFPLKPLPVRSSKMYQQDIQPTGFVMAPFERSLSGKTLDDENSSCSRIRSYRIRRSHITILL